MISLLLFGLVASTYAAPRLNFRPHGSSPFFHDYHMRGEPLSAPIFDTSKFWADISKELREIDSMLADFTRHFPTSVSREGIEGDEYRIAIPLSGFEEKDIVVKAREGLLMIQATHNAGSQTTYLDIRTLPSTVNVNGTWTFENSVLKVVFPLKERSHGVEPVTVITVELTTQAPFVDREIEEVEINNDKTNKENVDVDVGLNRGDQETDREVLTNEIYVNNAVEATTYAVDVKDDIEFVPVRY